MKKKVKKEQSKNKVEKSDKKPKKIVQSSFIKRYGRWLILLLAIWLTLVLFVYWSLEMVFANRVAWGLQLDDKVVGGMTAEQLSDLFSEKKENMTSGVDLYWGDEKVDTVRWEEIGFDLDWDSCQDKVLYYDKSASFIERQKVRLDSLVSKRKVQCDLYFDEFDFLYWLNGLKIKLNQPAKSYSIEKDGNTFILVEGYSGKVVDEKALKDQMISSIKNLNFDKIDIGSIVEEPQVTKLMAEEKLDQVQNVLRHENVDLTYKDWKIPLNVDLLADWIKFELRPANNGQEEYVLTYDLNKIDNYFNEMAYEFEVKPVDARLKMTEQGVQVESEGQDGLMINRIKFLDLLENKLSDSDLKVLELPVEETKAGIDGKKIDDLGIVELLASGESDYSWSPVNRVHNIAVGAEKFDGTVIAPGEEFSFTSRLGMVGPAEGFLPELVIADNETRPEYGGGLCQVSTTMYRAAINSGLPITERHPHQYRVSYYEPAGMDATIYVPSPDLKFVNDTGNYILIESIVSDYTLRFNFYGKKDGRKVEVTEPFIYNITSPPAPVYIYTSSLAAGEKYQVDSAHYGADAIFYRTIITPDGKEKKEEFFSRYQAWPAKFKVGEGEVKKEINNEQLIIDNKEDKKNDNQTDQGVGENDLSPTV